MGKKSALSEEEIKQRILEATAAARSGLPQAQVVVVVRGDMQVTSPNPNVKVVKEE